MGTVANPFIELKEDLVVKSINNVSAKFYNYDGMMKILKKFWEKESKALLNLVKK